MQPVEINCKRYTISAKFGQCERQTVGFDNLSSEIQGGATQNKSTGSSATFTLNQLHKPQRLSQILYHRFKCGGYPYFSLKFISTSKKTLGVLANWPDRDVSEWLEREGRVKGDEESGVVEVEEGEVIVGLRVGVH